MPEKYYLSDARVKRLLDYTERNKINGNGFASKFHSIDDKMSTIKVGGGGSRRFNSRAIIVRPTIKRGILKSTMNGKVPTITATYCAGISGMGDRPYILEIDHYGKE